MVSIPRAIFDQNRKLRYTPDETGLCDKDDGALTTGIKAETKIGVTVDLVAEARLGKGDKGPKTQGTVSLYSTALPIATTCVPMFIPALVAAAPTGSPDNSLGALRG